MCATFWILSVVLALAFATTGVTKLLLSKSQLMLRGVDWVSDFSSTTVRFVGLTELVGAIGMLLPLMITIPRNFALAAGAVGLVVIMLGAALIHARRREASMIAWNAALLALAAISLWGRCRC